MAKQYNYDTEFWGDKGSPGSERNGKKPPKKKSNALNWLLVLLVFFIGFMYFGFQLSDSWLDTGVVQEEPQKNDNGALTPGQQDKTLTLLLTGVDRREKEASRSDTIIVAFINLDKHSINLLSIPRDTYAQVPGHGKTKINHAHAYGGSDLLQTSVQGLLGVEIQRHVELDFQGFINVVNLFDGLEVNVEQDMYYPPESIDLKKGRQTLDGEDALGYVRFRSDGRGDIGRIERQQHFLKLLMDKMLRVQTLWKVPELIGELRENVQTDLSLKDMITLATELKDISADDLHAAMIPGEPTYIEELSYWQPDYPALQKILDDFQNPKSEK